MAHPNPRWRCIQGCGACCRLDPALRSEALALLDAAQRQQYLAMVGEDGWCIHYDTGGRRCRIYDSRPEFCRVGTLMAMLGVQDGAAADALAIACCKQQMRSEGGGRGKVLRRYLRALRQP